MPTLALAVIAYDEERGLPLTIESVRGLVDEIVVAVDSRTDRTRDLGLPARVLDETSRILPRTRPWRGSAGAIASAAERTTRMEVVSSQ